MAAGAGVALGFMIFLVTILAVLAIWQNKKGVSNFWTMLLRVAQLVYVVLGFIFLIATIVVGIASEFITDINRGIDDNLQNALAEGKQANKDYYTKMVNGPAGTPVKEDLTDVECIAKGRAKIKSETED